MYGRLPTVAPEALFKQGLEALAVGKSAEACQLFERAMTVERSLGNAKREARYLSYYGFSKAKAHGATHEAVRLCEEAVGTDIDPDLVLNLVRVYLLAGLRTKALATLERARSQHPDNRRLRDLLVRIDRRARPPLGFLDRDHSINRLLVRVLRRRPADAPPPGAAGR
jgi:tetratricopeptide (TPR) repeat protein